MAIKELYPKFIIAAIPLIVGMLLLLWQESTQVWLVYGLMAIGLLFLKPVFDGWMLPFWKLLIVLCGVVLLLEMLMLFLK
jgi:antibiotic biosynthesis monooxygenase (ABM) superfamily enzyme